MGRIIGIEAQFRTFFGAHLAELLLKHTNNLNKSLQATVMSAVEGKAMAAMTITMLQNLHNDEHFSVFWDLVMVDMHKVDVDEPKLPRRRKVPRKRDNGAPGDFPLDAQAHYHQIRCIDADEALSFVCNTNGDDFNHNQLHLHLDTLRATFSDNLKSPTLSFSDVKRYLQSMTVAKRTLISEVNTLVKLILVLPSINPASERTFIAMRHLKTYLRSFMKLEHLYHLQLLHIHKDETDNLLCINVTRPFVGDSEHRLSVFGHFC